MNSTIPVGNRFADYFVICGLDLNSGLEPDNFSGDNLQCTPLDRSYKARVLGHYPENVPWNPFDNNAVCMLCLPHGLQFRTQKHCLDPQFHSFVITREDGTRSYGFSYVFYEEIRNKKLCSAMQTLQAMHLTELSSSRMGNGNRRNKQGQIGHEGHNTRSLPRHFKLSTHQQGAAQSYYDVTKDVLYATKSIALICQLAYVHAAQKFLTGLYRCHTSHSSDKLSIESYVYNLLYEVPLPHPGRSIRFACYCGGSEVYENLVLQRPSSIEELPLFDFSLQELFRLLGLDCVIQLFTCVLLENQILLCSSDYQRLMLVAESITCLLFPFFWQHVYVPILPSSLQHFLDAPVPFIMGLHSNASHFRVASQGNLCYVDIDTRNIQLPEELPNFPQRNEFVAELSELLKRYNIPTGPLISSSIQILNAPNIMTSSCTLPSGFHPRRKHSWSHDSDSGVSDSSSINGSHSSISGSPQSDALQKVVAIVRKTGVNLDGIDGNLNLSIDDNDQDLTPQEQYEQELKFNNAVREIFLNRFVYIFSAYEHFIIQPNQAKKLMVSMHAADKEQWLSNRDSMQNFDKATFLSDQPELHLPFLSRFIESQMFATLIDNKIMSNWSEVDPNLRVFDRRIQLLRKHFGDGLVRTPSYEPCTTIRETQLLLDKRLASQDVYVPLPQEILQQSSSPVDPPPRSRSSSNFPLLDTNALNKEFSHRARKRSNAQLRQRRERNQHRSHTVTNNCNSTSTNSTHQDLDELQNKENKTLPNSNSSSLNSVGSLRQPKLSDVSPAVIAQTNWSFVEKLLRDVKSKTKRMLVEKMGTEAVELGHGEVSIVGVEENTLIASLCDLLERIWSHGLQNKQGKSALWTHLTSFQDLQDCNDASKPIDPSFLTPALAWCVLRRRLDLTTSPTKFGLPELFLSIKSGNIFEIASYITSNFDLSSVASDPDATPSPPRGRERQKTPERRSPMERKSLGNTDQPILRPIPVSLTFDMRNVQAMSDIKTHIGYARAWVRLSLEKKLLSRHLRTLLADTALLRSLYKRYAFLRCEEEKEQFLYHLLTLNAVDYFCFTNTYPNTKLPYRVVIFPSRKASAATTTANSWVTISGTLNETSPVPIPRGALEFVFHHKNLGVLTTLSIGHDNTGMSPKWMIEHIVVRNEVTGHTYKFPCGRWLGRGIDDGSTERLLVGELVPRHVDSDELVESCRTPPRCRSPSIPRRPSELRPTAAEIQHMLGDAVNNIVKFFYKRKHERDRSTLTVLLCGEMGLVYCLEQAFLHGFRSARWLGRNLYLWDYFVRVKEQFEITLSEMEHHEVLSESLSEDERQEALEHGAILRCYCHLVDQIITSSHTLGKDGKFQLFICLCAREHLLHHMLPHLASCRVTVEMYEEQSFLRNETHFTYLKQILESLDEFDIVLENSLTKGIEL